MWTSGALIVIFSIGFVSSNVYIGSAIFERLSHFKNDGVVNHLNTVNQAMIADGSCRMVNENMEGFALWHNKEVTDTVINGLKEVLPGTGKPSYFTLNAIAYLKTVCPAEEKSLSSEVQEEFTCRGGGYDAGVMAGAMRNWQRALCAPEGDDNWEVRSSLILLWIEKKVINLFQSRKRL